ncbi:ATP-binding cassette domain-containing protein [Pedobacter petrophilus]|uniref:ATP-binding cassette domain-containing protein n=1 Tax=Pedobacter petrophilus TaxID=1908241 RepID=A0A7K0G012_9SPHI|nr:ATP-binding cassette domain-containing protein [Pedobacter petrophilus]MRX76336.1 ATP-binding cassette domain-containing protein [Pedobacter petrophilus]
MIKIQSLVHQYPNVPALRFPDWEIKDREQWLLLGSSGSGKSTLLNIIAGLLKPKGGNVIVDGTSVYDLSLKAMDQFRGQKIGIIFQRPHFIKSLNIYDNIAVASSFAGLPVDGKRILMLLDNLGLAGKAKSYAEELSQGQLQRASIARALINRPSVLIADEPTSSLDDENAENVISLLTTQAASSDASLIVATHDKRVRNRLSKEYLL